MAGPRATNAIIYYDCHTQGELEQVVRNIVSARNNIRKGKITHLGPGIFFQAARFTGALTQTTVLAIIRARTL